VTHPSPNLENGEIRVSLPNTAGRIKLVWGYGNGSLQGDHIKNLGPDFYHLMITDLDSRCQAIVKNIQLKEQPRDE